MVNTTKWYLPLKERAGPFPYMYVYVLCVRMCIEVGIHTPNEDVQHDHEHHVKGHSDSFSA